MAEEVLEEQLVVFELAREHYGVNISKVQEIIRSQEITEVPRAPEFIEGVINLRGKITPVVDLRKRFGLSAGEHSKDARIVVVEVNGHLVGLMVDRVSEVLRVSRECVEPPSPPVTTLDSAYLKAIAKLEDRLIILLDLDRVLNKEEELALKEV
ncbi:MAG: chemotaxis protein CheW [Candidatus Tectomicrobia bacterium]|uniref:Chemotaxis protein CheW n=1 Tax=Tectimicrobiota bacterium TaxID=2528274 RepID=A0A932CLJ6_UNCTE|nr:chemotaxis protein CheW [Candidatus Tectomicrobia bacterium]